MKIIRKSIVLLLTITFLQISRTAYANTTYYGNRQHGAYSTEIVQLKYLGHVWTYRAGASASIHYYRNGAYLGGARVYKDSWRRDNTRIGNSVTVWDTLNPWANKTVYYVYL